MALPSFDWENIVPTIKYLAKTVEHKVYVFRAGLWTGAPLWRLIIHDWSKFTPSEAPHYGRNFYGRKDDPDGFVSAWLHHQNANPHHWEYWVARSGAARTGDLKLSEDIPVAMPVGLVREMVADWLGASRAYSGYWPTSAMSWVWFSDNWFRIAERLHPETILEVERIMARLFDNPDRCLACHGDDTATFGASLGGSICYDVGCPVCYRTGRSTDRGMGGLLGLRPIPADYAAKIFAQQFSGSSIAPAVAEGL